MPKEYTLPGGSKLRRGQFKIGNVQFPENWLELATPADLTQYGITVEDVTDPVVTPRIFVSKATIVERLNTAGRLQQFRNQMNSAGLLTQERWGARTGYFADDTDFAALITGAGADPAVIMASET